MRILLVTKFLPLPADSGGKQRSAAVLRRLAAVGDVTLAAFDDGSADHAALRDLGVTVLSAPRPGLVDVVLGVVRTRSITAARFSSRALRRQVREAVAAAPVDCLVVAYGQLAPYAAIVPARHKVLDLHNVESALMGSYAESGGPVASIAARLERRALRRIERVALQAYDTITVVSEVDLERLPAPHPHVLTCPNGWEPSPPLPPAADPVVAFVGLLGWTPNVDAAVWLVEAVWPHVRRAMPEARLLLVGRDPAPAVLALASEDVTVTGTVPDVRPYLERTRVAVAPLRAGGGSRLKIIEALGAGRPVVATSVGAEGLHSLVGQGLLLADDPRAFADVLVELLRDPERAGVLGRAGHEAAREQLSWDRTLAPLVAAVRDGRR